MVIISVSNTQQIQIQADSFAELTAILRNLRGEGAVNPMAQRQRMSLVLGRVPPRDQTTRWNYYGSHGIREEPFQSCSSGSRRLILLAPAARTAAKRRQCPGTLLRRRGYESKDSITAKLLLIVCFERKRACLPVESAFEHVLQLCGV